MHGSLDVGREIEDRILEADGDGGLRRGVSDEVAAGRGVEHGLEIAHVVAQHADTHLLEQLPVVVARGRALVAGPIQLELRHVVE